MPTLPNPCNFAVVIARTHLSIVTGHAGSHDTHGDIKCIRALSSEEQDMGHLQDLSSQRRWTSGRHGMVGVPSLLPQLLHTISYLNTGLPILYRAKHNHLLSRPSFLIHSSYLLISFLCSYKTKCFIQDDTCMTNYKQL